MKSPYLQQADGSVQVFDAVAAECAEQEIYVVLDNHVSKAGWCCNPFDGNSWWGDTHFSITNWTRGLAYMAEHVGVASALLPAEHKLTCLGKILAGAHLHVPSQRTPPALDQLDSS